MDLLHSVGFFKASGDGVRPIDGADILAHVTATDLLVCPAGVSAAIAASRLYVNEQNRSRGNSTDAPWDWPKSARDMEIINAGQERVMKAMMGD